jgi:hypothetical protein
MTNDFPTHENVKIPEEFYRIINDFTTDIKTTFPEYTAIIQRWWKFQDFSHIENENERETLIVEDRNKCLTYVFKHCMKILPERFFDILYKNEDIYAEENEINTEFLPGIVFKQLWYCDISEKTRDTIWKYLQLILFSVIGSVHNTAELGDTAKLFEAINEDELKKKLEETLEGMQNLFSQSQENGGASNDEETNSDNKSREGMNMPNAEDLHSHLQGMMEGKLGKLAMELAEETAEELNLDMENITNSQDVFKKLFSNPGKLMNMVKNVGGKLDEKIKSGEIKESELISEGMELLNKMKGMPGMENMKEMFSKLGMQGLGKGSKLNTGAMEAQLNRNLKTAQMKERMRTKMEQKKQNVNETTTGAGTANLNLSQTPRLTEEEIISIFSTGEKGEKTPRGAKPNDKKKKNKKK